MGAYYYAAGRKVRLETDDEHVAVDLTSAVEAGLEADVAKAAEGSARQSTGVVLAQRSALGEATIARLRKARALHPVYRHDQALMVPLSEVRVEFNTLDEQRAVLDLLAEKDAPPHHVSDSTEDRLIVRPASGDAADALTLANTIYERAHPAAASVRFLQFVSKPSTRG